MLYLRRGDSLCIPRGQMIRDAGARATLRRPWIDSVKHRREACHGETLTGETVDSNIVEAMAQAAYDTCGAHPDATWARAKRLPPLPARWARTWR